MINKALFSTNSDNWATPKNIYNYYVIENNFFDPCPLIPTFRGDFV